MSAPAEYPWTVHDIRVSGLCDLLPQTWLPHTWLLAAQIDGKSNELMKGQGGKDVYLVAERSQNFTKAITGVYFAHVDDERSGWSDLAKGAGGNYVYLEATWDRNNRHKMTDVALLRSDSGKGINDVQARGWTGMSNDINKGRGHDYLYLVWKTTRI